MSEIHVAASAARLRQHNVGRLAEALLSRLAALGPGVMRVGMVTALAWIGAMKFSAYEATAIEGLVANSPFLSWGYQLFSVSVFAKLLGTFEIALALMIASKPISPRAAAMGSALASGMFLTALTFIISTPGVFESSLGGFPALSVLPGQFLLKDVVLLGASLWLLGDALEAIKRDQSW